MSLCALNFHPQPGEAGPQAAAAKSSTHHEVRLPWFAVIALAWRYSVLSVCYKA
jgi:hypothetical protein